MNTINGLFSWPQNHIYSKLAPNRIIDIAIKTMAVEEIPHSANGFAVLEAKIADNHLVLDLGYRYAGGDGPALKAYSDLKRTGNSNSDVHLYLEREPPVNIICKGKDCKDRVRIPLKDACFAAPLTIRLHHTSGYNRTENCPERSEITIQIGSIGYTETSKEVSYGAY